MDLAYNYFFTKTSKQLPFWEKKQVNVKKLKSMYMDVTGKTSIKLLFIRKIIPKNDNYITTGYLIAK